MSVEGAYDPRYPIGRFSTPAVISLEERRGAMGVLAEFPAQLRAAVAGLDAGQLGTAYREGGWTVRQLVHHCADSHMNLSIRVRLALTEEWPTIKPYDQDAWVKLNDAEGGPVEWSLGIVDGVHARWVRMLEALTEEQWQRGFVHPEGGPVTVEVATLLYAWHSRHHLAHITRLRERKGW